MMTDQPQNPQTLDQMTAVIAAQELEKSMELGIKLFAGLTDPQGLPRLDPTQAMQLGASIVAYASSGALERDIAEARQDPERVMAHFDGVFAALRDGDRQEQRRLALTEEDWRQAARQHEARAILQRSNPKLGG